VCVHCAVVCAPRNVLGAVSTGRNATYVLDARTGMECISSERGSRSASPRGAGAPGCLLIPAPAKKRNNHHTLPGTTESTQPRQMEMRILPSSPALGCSFSLATSRRGPSGTQEQVCVVWTAAPECPVCGCYFIRLPLTSARLLLQMAPRASSQWGGGDSQVLRFWQDARRAAKRWFVNSSSLRTGRSGDAGFRQGRLGNGGNVEGCCGQHRDAQVQREHGCPGSRSKVAVPFPFAAISLDFHSLIIETVWYSIRFVWPRVAMLR
jgi:hypothetical protein